MPSVDRIPSLSQTLRKELFHFNGFAIRHRVEMRVQLRDKTDTELSHHACGLDAALVVVKALFGCQTRHAHVIGGVAVPLGVSEYTT